MFLIELCKAFNNAGLEYALAGGYAVSLHGAPRGTLNLDFVLTRNLENYRIAVQVLETKGLKPIIPLTIEDFFQCMDSMIESRNLVAWSFVDARNPLHCVDL